MITFSTANHEKDLHGILTLQKKNLEENITPGELMEQGFVTVKHDLPLLQAMNTKYQHAIAKNNEQVIGYALVMLKDFAPNIPVLMSLFDQIDTLSFRGIFLKNKDYFVMGQVCIAKSFRGKGVFAGIYQILKNQMQSDFNYVITSISTRNSRSLRAHTKVGFQTIHTFFSEINEEWDIVIWDWT